MRSLDLKLKKHINFPLCLAPMVGLSHVALRMVLREYLPSNAQTIWPTEMLNSRRLPGENLAKTPETMRSSSEEGLVPQILGNEEAYISKSVQRLVDWGAEGIDINMGCPVEKALKHNYGVALMGDPRYAAQVVEMTVQSSSLPVSVKLRSMNDASELDKENEKLLNFSKAMVEAGVSWLTLHPRTPEQKRRGNADWSQIRFLKQNLKVPVIGNGDIQTCADVLQMLKETNCDLVMSGRALAARPWMLWQLGECLGFDSPSIACASISGSSHFRQAPSTPLEEGAEYGKVLRKLLHYSLEYFSEDVALRKFCFHVKTTSIWLPFGHELYARLTQTKAKHGTGREMLETLNQFFDQNIEMSQKTELRQ